MCLNCGCGAEPTKVERITEAGGALKGRFAAEAAAA